MSKKRKALILAVSVAAFTSCLFLAGNPTADRSATAYYKHCIDRHIRIYLFKESLYKNSRFEHLRKSGSLAVKKAVFLKTNRNRLVEEMTEQQIGRKHYHVQAYLNKEFDESRQKENRIASRSMVIME